MQERMKKKMNKKDEKEMGDEHEERIQKTTKQHVMRDMRKTVMFTTTTNRTTLM